MTTETDEMAEAIDGLDNLAHALLLPMPAQVHVDCLRDSLPLKVSALKSAFVAVTGENPWGQT